MEDPGTSGPESAASPPAGAPKSKLDTLSKEDLIKFSKKQMAAMQKMKAKCADFEKEVEALKQQVKSSNNSSEDAILIQELTERMDALLLEKAETQQSLVLSRKELERSKLQAKDALQAELDSVKGDHQRKIRALEDSIKESNIRHQDEVARFQSLLAEREQRDREEASEREERQSIQRRRTAGDGGTESSEEAQGRHLEAELQSLRAQLELIQEGKSREVCELQERHQREVTEAQQEVENLREELAQRRLQHEEEMRALEEDCEVERERLLLLHDELTEQLALKDSYLQDVQEEDEDPARGSGIARMLELSRSSQGAPGCGDAEALEDLQAQNTMLQDELTLLSNVKAELEAELQRTREESQTEREELEFKIDELQMCREGDHAPATAASGPDNFDPAASPADPAGKDSVEEDRLAETPASGAVEEQKPTGETLTSITMEEQSAPSHHDQDQQQSSGPEGQQKLQELRAQCEALASERDSALAEHRHTLEVLRGLETELGVTAGDDLVCRYKATKEEGAGALRDLQEKIRDLGRERDGLADRVGEIAEENTNLTERIQALDLKLEASLGETRAVEDLMQKLRASVEERETLAGELKASVAELTTRNEEILSQLQLKETLAQELEETVGALTTERDRTQSQLRLREDEVDRLSRLREEKERDVDAMREELEDQRRERELLIEERRKTVDGPTGEAGDREGRVETLKLTIKEMSSEKVDLVQKVEEASAALSLARDERQRLASELAALGLQLEQESLEKRDLEARLKALTEEAERAGASAGALEDGNRTEEALRSSAGDVQDLRARVEELESERDLLKSSLEEAQGRGRSPEEVPAELRARMEELRKEKSLLEGELEEVVGDTEALQKDLEDMKAANEKLRAENQELQATVALVVRDKEEEDEEEEETKEQEREKERRTRELEEQLTEKEALIVQLRSEMAALQSAVQAAPSEENIASQFAEKIALLEKELKEKNERMNKIKAVAVKAKKELDASKKEAASLKEEVESLKVQRERVSSSMKDIIHGAEGYKNMQMDYDRQTEQLDKQREMAEAAKRQIAELTKQLSTAETQNGTLSGEKQALLASMDTMRSTVRQLESQCQELSRRTASLDRDLLAERTTKDQKTKELSSSMKQVEELTRKKQQLTQDIEELYKDARRSSNMELEMKEMEVLVEKQTTDLSDKQAVVEELEAQILTHTQRENTFQQDIEGLKSQLTQKEDEMSRTKQDLVKTRKEVADAKKQEASHVRLQASLKGELEANLQQLESSKIQLCEVTAECHRLQEQLRCVTEQQHRSSSSLQQCISSLQQECDTAKAELASTTAEFESYKVRVHNVLKQQKNKSSSQSDGEPGKLEREQLSGQVEQLRSRLSESQQSLQSSAAELQQLHAEHDTLLDRHNKMLQENISKEAELRERLLAVQSEKVGLRSEQAQVQAELQGQAEAQRQAFREQVRRLQDEHRATVDTLQGQLGRLEEQLFTVQNHNGSGQVQSARKALLLSSDPQRGSSRTPAGEQSPAGGPGGFMSVGDLQSMAREEGEGMETTETERSSPAHTPLPSLEQLLTSPDPKQEPFVWALEPTKEELSHKLTTATRSMEHMNSLLHETEATNAVLMEQITLLKSEVRRLERNQEREKSAANLEYLKNVLLQFIFLHSGSERQALLPVIHTMLQLSPEEKSKLAAIAHGEEEASGSRGSGWSSYLHSWSGIR